jgi:hypothetical protein
MEAQEGPVQLTVRVSDGKEPTASANDDQCIRPAVKEVVFETCTSTSTVPLRPDQRER